MTLNEIRERFDDLYGDLVPQIEETDDGAQLADVPADEDLTRTRIQIQALARNAASPDEASFMIAQKMFKRLYEGDSDLYRQVHVAILDKLRETCKRLPRELVNWMSYKPLDRDVTVALLAAGSVLNISDFDIMLSKKLDSGRNAAAVDYAAFVVSRCVVDQGFVAAAELSTTLEALSKISLREDEAASGSNGAAGTLRLDVPSAPEGLKTLVEQARAKPAPVSASQAPSSTFKGADVAAVHNAANVLAAAAASRSVHDPPGTQEAVQYIIEQWTFMYEMSRSARSVPDNVVSVYVGQSHALMSSEESRERVVRVALDCMMSSFYRTSAGNAEDGRSGILANGSGRSISILDSFKELSVSDTAGSDNTGALKSKAPIDLPNVIRAVSAGSSNNGSDGEGSALKRELRESASIYAMADAFSKLISAVLRIEASQMRGEEILYGVMSAIVQHVGGLQAAATRAGAELSSSGSANGVVPVVVDLRLHFRLLSDLLRDLAPRMEDTSGTGLNTGNVQVLIMFANVLHALQPQRVPAFAFSWVELLAHRQFLPRIMSTKHEQGWEVFHRLLVLLLSFLAPHLRRGVLSKSVQVLYKGTLRLLLVLLHDFPEFLCDYHFALCDEIPSNCIQLRNLVLSAFPRSMRLPDPFLPDLKVDTLPEMAIAPRVLSNFTKNLGYNDLKAVVDACLKNRSTSVVVGELIPRLLVARPPLSAPVAVGAADAGVLLQPSKYNTGAINALVFYVGQLAIAHSQSGSPITLTPHMELFRTLVSELDAEGRYYFLNAVANQLRFPNNHTHYFSVVLLYMFADAKKEPVQEQIIRVLMERLIANRPHPWGLLITFIELIKNPRYNFWQHGFVRCAPEIQRLFETVARSCMGNTESAAAATTAAAALPSAHPSAAAAITAASLRSFGPSPPPR